MKLQMTPELQNGIMRLAQYAVFSLLAGLVIVGIGEWFGWWGWPG